MGCIDISIDNNDIVFRTPFNDDFDFVQFYRGLTGTYTTANSFVDARLTGVQKKKHPDIWHVDTVFSFTNDDTSPFSVNGAFIGAGHGQPSGVVTLSDNHGKTCRDIGSLWRDEDGILWTLISVPDANRLMFLSSNIGESVSRYRFKKAITGKLSHIECAEHTEKITYTEQFKKQLIFPATRRKKLAVYAVKDGVKTIVTGDFEGADSAEIHEEYDIMNPALISEALRAKRPDGGYSSAPDLSSFGLPMLNASYTHIILEDGTYLTHFKHKILSDIDFYEYMGVMAQPRSDAFGGGIKRYIPKLGEIVEGGKKYDFSCPRSLSLPYPQNINADSEFWEYKDMPPERSTDFLLTPKGKFAVAFAIGFLPVFDGRNEVRKKNDSAYYLYRSQKIYPKFSSHHGTETVHGVGYKKYFTPGTAKNTLYTIDFDGTKYIYIDIFSTSSLCLDKDEKTLTCIEKSDSINIKETANRAYVSGDKGFAVFALK